MTNEITINPIELASELAHQKLMNVYAGSIKIYKWEEGEEGSSSYTEEAQDIFNEYYDEFLTLIESISFNPKKTENEKRNEN